MKETKVINVDMEDNDEVMVTMDKYESEIIKEGKSKDEDSMKEINAELASLKKIEYKDFHLIMEDYNSEDEKRIKQSKEDACNNLKGFVIYMIMHNYWTYCRNYFQDMLQCGYIGIMKAMKSYDPDKAMPTTFFKTFIKHEISCYITEFLNGSTVHYATTLGEINKAKRHFESLGIPYDNVVLAEYLGRPRTSVAKALACQEAAISVNFQEEFENKTDESAPASARCDMYMNPERCLEEKALSEVIATAIKHLTKVQQNIILMYYGFTGSPMSVKQISMELGISQSEVKFEHQMALANLYSTELRVLCDDKYKEPKGITTIEYFPEPEEELDIVEFTLDDFITADTSKWLAKNPA